MTNDRFKIYDVFHAFLVKDSDYDGYIELPKITTSNLIPQRIVPFSKAMAKSWTDFECWVMFYEHDIKFERIWKNPKQYLKNLKSLKVLYLLILVFTEICLL